MVFLGEVPSRYQREVLYLWFDQSHQAVIWCHILPLTALCLLLLSNSLHLSEQNLLLV